MRHYDLTEEVSKVDLLIESMEDAVRWFELTGEMP